MDNTHNSETKQCTKCGEFKPLVDGFYKRQNGDLRTDCKACNNERRRKCKDDNFEREAEVRRKWYEDNRDKLRAANRKWQEDNREYRRDYERKRREADPERFREKNRKYREANPEKIVQYSKANPEKRRARERQWRADNIEHRREIEKNKSHRRRLLFDGITCDLTVEQWEMIKAAYNYRCAYCRKKKPLTQDHVVPVSKGGAHTASNIVPACQSCNSSKRAGPPKTIFQPHLIGPE